MTVSKEQRLDYLARLMSLYWLRPEAAVWRAADCVALHDVEFRSPILDIGCGDGLFSFIRGGGRLTPEYDVFLQTANLDAFLAKTDIYDHFDAKTVAPVVAAPPRYRIDLGLDHKRALLQKASALGCYAEVRECDANGPLQVPAGMRYRTVFSNILYWLENYRFALTEIRRILADDGVAVLLVPNENFIPSLIYQRLYVQTQDPRWAWLDLIDRGRSQNVQLCQSAERWTRDFGQAGLRVVRHQSHLSRLFLQMWDIGLRPISNLLIEMANGLSPTDRLRLKQKWVDQMLTFCEPICDLDSHALTQEPGVFHLFVLGPA
jgi:SAM-dependent methyltransferase